MRINKALRAAFYARVSSTQQAQKNTVASQVYELKQRIKQDGLACEDDLCFIDDGYSGSTLVRPALEQLRDVAAAGGLDRVYIHAPDRLARRYAYQVLLMDELRQCRVELIFLNGKIGTSPEEELLLQVQGVVAEYERAKILERSRRGKRHAARCGRVNVLGSAPYGYRYVGRHEGEGEAGYQVVFEQARAVEQMFRWISVDRLSIAEVCKRLKKEGLKSPRGRNYWDRSTVWGMLTNPAYKGTAAFGRTRTGPVRPRLRPQRGQPEHPRRASSKYDAPPEDWILIPVPAIVSEPLFEAVAEQLEENRVRNRRSENGVQYLLGGLLVCRRCGRAFCGTGTNARTGKGKRRGYGYYRCIGTDPSRHDGQRLCHVKSIRTDVLEPAVWDDVCSLLNEPERIEQEYQRRLANKRQSGRLDRGENLAASIKQIKRGVARLIDGYETGLLERAEFEPRIKRAKERLAKLEAEARQAADKEAEEREFRLVIGRLHEFADRVKSGLDEADHKSRREIIRVLVKHVEINEDDIRIVYRVSPPVPRPGNPGPIVQHCRDRGSEPWVSTTPLNQAPEVGRRIVAQGDRREPWVTGNPRIKPQRGDGSGRGRLSRDGRIPASLFLV
jgi:site-specific DNA recombinase